MIAGNYLNKIQTLNNNNDTYSSTTTGYGNNITSWANYPAANLKF